ncbi:hypothetical protein EV189_4047 [Motilibacter rhizosphaerae]|uniref:Uncharacterized protein n=1 Tax=Motilibacter rhizosphaerae TaxID=598652 RepID=A0A4V2F2E2_9ACTN|nr:hypothetical protein [Motilibacter rhizosphaerae]RZS77516.1 hypothetical protein EV189_4047 [Motilibacter rhizosphaerae]
MTTSPDQLRDTFDRLTEGVAPLQASAVVAAVEQRRRRTRRLTVTAATMVVAAVGLAAIPALHDGVGRSAGGPGPSSSPATTAHALALPLSAVEAPAGPIHQINEGTQLYIGANRQVCWVVAQGATGTGGCFPHGRSRAVETSLNKLGVRVYIGMVPSSTVRVRVHASVGSASGAPTGGLEVQGWVPFVIEVPDPALVTMTPRQSASYWVMKHGMTVTAYDAQGHATTTSWGQPPHLSG